jgi:hypothetical protein
MADPGCRLLCREGIGSLSCSPELRLSIVEPAMPKSRKNKEGQNGSDTLKGWNEIAAFLGQPVSVAQRWADSGMPVEKRGRYVYSSREQLNQWLGRESAGEPVQIATPATDLSAELKRGLSFVRKHGGKKRAA